MGIFASLDWRRVLTALAAMLIAFGAGFVMQRILVDDTPLATVNELPDAAPILRSAEEPQSLPTPPAATLVPLLPPPPIEPDRVQRPEPGAPEIWDDAGLSPFGLECTPELQLTLGDAAMIHAVLSAPCNRSERVTFRHGDLEVDVTTSAYGRAEIELPALEPLSTVFADLGDQSAKATVSVRSAREYSRVVLVWEGTQIYRMHAYELGAKRGQAGHIWSGSAKTPARAMRGTGGFLLEIGDGTGRSAEVYTFPTGQTPLRGVIELVVEADVTEDTCGKLASATALQTSPLGGMTSTDVQVTLPGCDRAGEVLELKNLLQDMRLAGR